jgi:hypothetical protein
MQLPVGDEVTSNGAFLISPYRVLGPFHGRDGDSDPSFVLIASWLLQSRVLTFWHLTLQ